MKTMNEKHIAILDFGSQYMHLISRRIRQLGVLAKIYPTDVNAHDLKDAWGIVISGGPNSVNDQKLAYDPGIFELGIPVLGLCYGHQLMAYQLGGVVTPAHNREYGMAQLLPEGSSPLLNGLAEQEQVWMSHWDSVTAVPDGFTVIGKTADCPVAAMANEEKKLYGLQFHPEVHHSKNGIRILENFVFAICGAQKNWSMQEYVKQLKQQIKEQVGDRNVFLFVSGGVDSSVAFALLQDILGRERVYGLHVDNGCMRTNESAEVKESLARAGFDNLHVVDASDRFLQALEGMTEPEEKRKTIGRVFLEVQREEFAKMNLNPDEWLLGQGTIYPDTIETGGTETSETIKTHHNRVDEVIEMINKGLVIEPLCELYKDEVREIGAELGLPAELLNRWPFPGPGLGIRVLCSTGNIDETIDQEATTIQLQQVLEDTGMKAAVLPIKSVGVQGDQRSYLQAVVLQGPWKSWDELNTLSTTITNTVSGVSRVVLDVTPEHTNFAHMQLVAGTVTQDRLDILRAADDIVAEVVDANGVHGEIWQFPVILLPLSFGAGGETIVLRPFESQEVMTANFYPMDPAVLVEMTQEIVGLEGIDAVFYDITNKPPGTTEWE